MKYISFDVGIKNLAYILMDIPNHTFDTSSTIIDWNILNIEEKPICMKCKKNAIYSIIDTYYCGKHGKSSPYIMESIRYSSNLSILKELCKKYKLDVSSCKVKKDFVQLLKQKQLKKIKIDCSLHPMVKHGSSLNRQLNSILETHIESLDKIIIENQMTSKMRIIQGMLVQYFIGKGIPEKDIICITANKKLHMIQTKTTYKERKELSKEITYKLLEENQKIDNWNTFVKSSSKKDDLADSFLQCIAYIQKK